uniref:Uncharacterized protein n=1 Tax=Arundo donax TaxID=35708 RepID=A0A0A8Z0Q3_ARUDO
MFECLWPAVLGVYGYTLVQFCTKCNQRRPSKQVNRLIKSF